MYAYTPCICCTLAFICHQLSYFFLLPTYKIADIIEETANIPKANLNANKYVMASYPPLPSGILNMNEIEMKYDNIVSKIGITI